MTELPFEPEVSEQYLAARTRIANWINATTNIINSLSSRDSNSRLGRDVMHGDASPSRPQPSSRGHCPSNPDMHTRDPSQADPLYFAPGRKRSASPYPSRAYPISRSRSVHISKRPQASLQMIHPPALPLLVLPSSQTHNAPVSPTSGTSLNRRQCHSPVQSSGLPRSPVHPPAQRPRHHSSGVSFPSHIDPHPHPPPQFSHTGNVIYPSRHHAIHSSPSIVYAPSSFPGDDPHIGGSSSSLDTIGPPINRENPHLRPYPSSTNLQSNGSLRNASFMTSPDYDSATEA